MRPTPLSRLRQFVERRVARQAHRAVEADRHWRDLTAPECQGADFSRVMAHLAEGIEEHIRRDNLPPLKAALFRSRGGHTPGEICPTAPPAEPIHAMGCDLMADGEWCTCGAEP